MNFDIREFFKELTVLDHGSIALIDGPAMDPNLKIVNAARVSFDKESSELSNRDKKLISYLYDHGHLSTYRHSHFTFRVRAPLFVFRQWWKYQVGSEWSHDDLNSVTIDIPDTSWNEMSGRYVEFDDQFYTPSKFRMQSKDNKQGSSGEISEFDDGSDIKDFFVEKCQEQMLAYNKLIKSGVAKELARMFLPQNVYSECVWTCSTQTLFHFLEQRLKSDAQFEIREYAVGVYKLVSPFMPVIKDAFSEKEGFVTT